MEKILLVLDKSDYHDNYVYRVRYVKGGEAKEIGTIAEYLLETAKYFYTLEGITVEVRNI